MSKKIIDRLFEYLEYKKIPHTRFEKTIGLSNGYLNTQKKRNANLGEGVIQQILANCPDMNIEWLLTGEGGMLNSIDRKNNKNGTPELYEKIIDEQLVTISALQVVVTSQNKTIQSLRLLNGSEKE